jgi:hypothetical protein
MLVAADLRSGSKGPSGSDVGHRNPLAYFVGRYAPLFRRAVCQFPVRVGLGFRMIEGIGSLPLPARDLLYLLLIPVARIAMALFPTTFGRREPVGLVGQSAPMGGITDVCGRSGFGVGFGQFGTVLRR